jgi:hypothetical protein
MPKRARQCPACGAPNSLYKRLTIGLTLAVVMFVIVMAQVSQWRLN